MNKKSILILIVLLALMLLLFGCAEKLKAVKGLKKKAIDAVDNTPEGKITNKLSTAFNNAANCTPDEFKLKIGLLAGAASEAGLELPQSDEEIKKYLEMASSCKPEYVQKVFKAKGSGKYEVRYSFKVVSDCPDQDLQSFVIDNFLVIEVDTKTGTSVVKSGKFDEESLAELPSLEAALGLAGNCTAPLMIASGLLANAVGEEEAVVDETLPEVSDDAMEEDETALEQQVEQAAVEPAPAVEPATSEPATAPTPAPTPPSPQPTEQGNTTIIVERLFPGQYDNTKYSIKIKDPDKIQRLSVNKADGSGVLVGAPPCLEEIPSGTVTLLPSDFPLKATVGDCKDKTATYTLTAEMPALPAPKPTPAPTPTSTQSVQTAASCTDSDASSSNQSNIPGNCVDSKGTFTDTCTVVGDSPTTLKDYGCRATFESTSPDQKFCVEQQHSCPYGCKDGRCLTQTENPNACPGGCASYQKCVSGRCTWKNCDEVGGKICASGEQCTSRLIYSGENLQTRTCCENAKCETIQQTTAAEEKPGTINKVGNIWTYADFSTQAVSQTSTNADLMFYWGISGLSVSVPSNRLYKVKIARSGKSWDETVFATCINHQEYQQGYSGIDLRDGFTVICVKTDDGWVAKLGKASFTPAKLDYVAWKVG